MARLDRLEALMARLERQEAPPKPLSAAEKVALVERALDKMGRELYLREGAKRGYIEPRLEQPGQDVELDGVLFSSRDHRGEPGWQWSPALQCWVKVAHE